MIKTPAEHAAAMRCPYCGSGVQYVDSAVLYRGKGFGMIYLCAAFPACDARVGAHADGRPMGTLANENTRQARIAAHEWFDLLWKDGQLTRREAYRFLAQYLGVNEVHIGESDIATCTLIIGFAKTYLETSK